ncbi:MAG: hypothetical protein HYZ59_01985 [Actinobacteria bacterium]|nr:hypothetical protein [Actinomycetota bacterium]
MSTTEDARKAASRLAEAIREGNEASIVYWQVRLVAMERGRRLLRHAGDGAWGLYNAGPDNAGQGHTAPIRSS